MVACNDVDFLTTELSLSSVMVLHCLWPISRASLKPFEPFVDIIFLDTMFVNSGGSANGFSKCSNQFKLS